MAAGGAADLDEAVVDENVEVERGIGRELEAEVGFGVGPVEQVINAVDADQAVRVVDPAGFWREVEARAFRCLVRYFPKSSRTSGSPGAVRRSVARPSTRTKTMTRPPKVLRCASV